MKTCIECGQAMNDNDDFCMNCGARALQTRCAACGQTVTGDADFCMNSDAYIVRQTKSDGINFLLIQDEASTEKDGNSAKKPTERRASEKRTSTAKEKVIKSGDKKYETHSETVERQDNDGKRPLMYYMVTNKRLSRALDLGYATFFFTVVGLFICWLLHSLEVITLVSPHWIVVLGACVIMFFALIGYAFPVKSVTAENLRSVVKRRKEIDLLKLPIGNLIFMLIIISLWFLASVIVNMICQEIFLRGYIIAMVFCLAAILLYVLGARAVAKRNAAMAIYLWGWMSPTVDTPFVVDYDEEKERAAYEKYMSAPSVMRDMNEDDSTERHIRNRRIAVGVMAALFVAITAVIVPVSETVTDKFSANYAKHSVLPKEIEDDTLRLLYGDFNFKRPYGSNGHVVEYYSDNWLELYEEYYDLSKKIESGDNSITAPLVSRMKELELKMATLEYKYLAVYIRDKYQSYDDNKTTYNYLDNDKNNGWFYGYVVGIALDTARGSLIPKQAKETNFDVPTLWQNQKSSDTSAKYEIWYTDGSYAWWSDALPQFDTSEIGVQTYKAIDPFGISHDIYVNVVSR